MLSINNTIQYKKKMFFYILFSCFWRLMKPKRTMRSFTFFSKERKWMQRTKRSFAKNGKEHRERNILLKRTKKNVRMKRSFALWTYERFIIFLHYFFTFFYVLFSCFWRIMKPKRTMRFFTFLSKERKRTQRRQHSFAKNVKERREHSVLLQRM